jgi:hypothetical protein
MSGGGQSCGAEPQRQEFPGVQALWRRLCEVWNGLGGDLALYGETRIRCMLRMLE